MHLLYSPAGPVGRGTGRGIQTEVETSFRPLNTAVQESTVPSTAHRKAKASLLCEGVLRPLVLLGKEVLLSWLVVLEGWRIVGGALQCHGLPS